MLPLNQEGSRTDLPAIFISYCDLRVLGIPYTRVHLNRLIHKGLFPPPVRLSPNRIAWRMSDLLAWQMSRPCAREPRPCQK